MSYSPTTRDRYRLAVAAVSGAMTIGALSTTGLLAGVAAADHQGEQAQNAARQRADRLAYQQAKRERRALIRANKEYAAQMRLEVTHPHVLLRERPSVQHVTTRYVQAGSGAVGSGGSIGTSSGSSGSGSPGGSSGSGGSTAGSGGGGTPAPPPPPPPPPPAPSTGS